MAVKRQYSEEDKAVAVAALQSHFGDFKSAAKFSGVPEYKLKQWALGETEAVEIAIGARPYPPRALMDIEDVNFRFVPAPEILAWARTNVIGDGPLYNPEHDHLMDAQIGFLWTNEANRRNMRSVVGQARTPMVQGDKWIKGIAEQQYTEWWGVVPDFIITLDAAFCSQSDDPTFCALVEHELLHCAQATDLFGSPAYTQEGKPKFGIRGHDVEEHVSIVRRYGVGASASGVAELVEAANHPPTIARANISAACGTCLK